MKYTYRESRGWLLLLVIVGMGMARNASAYLDPGTGSYVLQIVVASLVGGIFVLKIFFGHIAGFFRNLFRKKDKDA
ncbi:MAG: hypothetical protein HN919_16155 [Verrucomicrobia bacterium]|jgi:hypothetical protein|nr:hypothetical protein [Verrucomicrobiota bacterium]MBT7067833.1 hypothetical protein [Verrucomicrobiota bacterium]MBT7699321.1 hypothetical protein [Verrucomicrobiota bacterium]